MSGRREFFRRNFHLAEASSLRRNLGLDVIRAVAILLVVFCHSLYLVPSFRYQGLLLYWSGFLGVEIFFVLSGYLIGGILLALVLDRAGEESFGRKLGGFWIRRWFRTLPNYYLFLAINFVVLSMGPSRIAEHWDYFVFAQNLLGPMGDFMAESWSLVIEEWFYLSFPLVLLSFTWLFGRSAKVFLATALLYVLMFGSLRTAGAFNGTLVQWDAELRKVALVRLDSIAYGALVMVFMKRLPDFMFRMRVVFFGAGLLGLGASFLILDQLLAHGASWWLAANHFTLTSLSSALLLPLAVYQTKTSGRSRFRTVVATVSIISYSMYLLHTLVAIRLVGPWFGHWTWQAQYALYWFLCFLLSYLVYVLYERRMTALRDHFSSRRKPETL